MPNPRRRNMSGLAAVGRRAIIRGGTPYSTLGLGDMVRLDDGDGSDDGDDGLLARVMRISDDNALLVAWLTKPPMRSYARNELRLYDLAKFS